VQQKLIIRADASTDIGTGHVMRMLALAQAWIEQRSEVGVRRSEVGEKEGAVLFICALIPDSLEQRLKGEGFCVGIINASPGSPDDLAQTLEVARRMTTDDRRMTKDKERIDDTSWFVTDGYPFDVAYQRAIRAAGYSLLVVDDYNHLPEYECDILLNQNMGAEEYDYNVNADATRLMGPRYALLRREFRQALAQGQKSGKDVHMASGKPAPTFLATNNDERRTTNDERTTNILLTMGGSDPHNVTGKVIEALNQTDMNDVHVKILLGAANPHMEAIQRSVSSSTIRYELINSTQDMPGLMQWADLAITAAGSTCWELLAMGVPMMTVILAENQARISRSLAEANWAIDLGWCDDSMASKIKRNVSDWMANPALLPGRNDVDSKGAERVVEIMRCHEH